MNVLLAAPGHGYSTAAWADGLYGGLESLRDEFDLGLSAFDYNAVIRFYELALPAVAGEFPTFGRLLEQEDTARVAALSLAGDRLPIAALEYKPDIVVIVNGQLFGPATLRYLDDLGVPWGVILTESPYEDRLDMQLKILELGPAFATTNDYGSYLRLSEEMAERVLVWGYLPPAYDAGVWKPLPREERGETLLWSFVGTPWPERIDLLAPLVEESERLGVPYLLHWAGLQPDGGVRAFSHEELAGLYNRTLVNVNIHREAASIDGGAPAHAGYTVNPRALEIAACEAFQVSDFRAGVADVFEDTVPTYEGADGLVDAVFHYAYDREGATRRRMARTARELGAEHSYRRRAAQLLDVIGQVLY